MRTARCLIVVMLALVTAVVVPSMGTANETLGDCAGLFPEPYVRPQECICWPCAENREPQGTDP